MLSPLGEISLFAMAKFLKARLQIRAGDLAEWPGNVRQLRASLRTLYLSSHGDVDKMLTGAAELIATSQRDRLLAALEQSEWNRTRAAEMFGVSEGTIRNWIRRYEIAETAGVEA